MNYEKMTRDQLIELIHLQEKVIKEFSEMLIISANKKPQQCSRCGCSSLVENELLDHPAKG